MMNHPESSEMSSQRNERDTLERKFGKYMAATESLGLPSANLPSTLARGKLTSANTPDSVNRLGDIAHHWHQFDLRFGTKRPLNVKYDNFPPGYNGILNMDLRRRSAEMAIQLNLHTREFPNRQTNKSDSADKSTLQEHLDTRDVEKNKHKAKKGRRNKKKKMTDENTEKNEISVFLENRETLTPGLFARGKPAPALYRENRQSEKKPEVVHDAQKVREGNDTGKTTATPTRDANVNQLLAEIDKKNEEYETYRKNDFFFNRFNSGNLDTEDLVDQKVDVLPPINGNAVPLGKRKTKINRIVSQINWNKVDNTETLRKGNAIQLPPINTANIEKSPLIDVNSRKVRGQSMAENILANENEYWNKAKTQVDNSAAKGLPLRHSSQPTLPPVFNVKLPPITGLPVQRTIDTRKRKGKRVA
ncbi:uncharacterized protein LOC117330020 [Pecten maximus]|uniref:uncharacterized protein LOC117330020 n=1 Tax=Pecten maximus TaxID=6579 RepID=UPI0014580B33|nr:uncharacterized protein LOC117330020 [Pecten maximus]